MMNRIIPAGIAAFSLALLCAPTAEAQGRGAPRPDRTVDRAPSSEQALADSRTAIGAAGVACEVTEARWIGRIAASSSELYEVACATGPGYLVHATTSPEAVNCLATAASTAAIRAEDPNAQVGEQCTLPANTDAVRALTPLVQSAGLNCTVDGAAWIGRTTSGNERYEVSCSGMDGYWVETPANSLELTNIITCLEVVQAGATCRLTGPDEQLATIARLAAPANRDCTPREARFVGSNENGRFYELACTETAGFMFRTDLEGAFQQAYDCAEARSIGGGCTLTDSQVIAASAADAETARLTQAGIRCTYQDHRRIGTDNRERMVNEYVCSDRPLGLIAFIGADAGSSEGMDCFTGGMRGVSCSLTPANVLHDTLTRLMAANNNACTVTDFRMLGYSERDRELVEMKCGEAGGFVAELPDNRGSVAGVLPCSRAEQLGVACEL